MWAYGCAALEPIGQGCGNSVVEEGEHCDGKATIDVEGGPYICRSSGPEQCRFDCKDSLCPPGFSCGRDNVCRTPSSLYEPRGSRLIGSSTLSFVNADADGDGRPDLLQLALDKTSVHFFDETGDVSATFDIPSLPFTPGVGDIDGDGLPDISVVGLFGNSNFGITSFLGSDNRNYLPRALFTLEFDTVLPDDLISDLVLAPGLGDATAVAITGAGIFAIDDLNGNLPTLSCTPAPPPLYAGTAIGNFDERGERPCDDIALAVAGSDVIELITTCVFDGDAFAEPPGLCGSPREISLVNGQRVRSAVGVFNEGKSVFKTHLRGIDDDHLDLIVLTESGDALDIQASWGVGDGQFHSIPGEIPLLDAMMLPDNRTASLGATVSIIGEPCGEVTHTPPLPHPPLAVANFSDDQFPDFIMTDGIYVSFDLGAFGINYTPTVCFDDFIDEVQVGDFNRDGVDDVAVNTTRDPAVDLYISSGDGVFSRTVIATDGLPVDNLVAGDFDADSVMDIGYVEPRPGDDGLVEQITVAFGSASGQIGAPQSFGTLPEIDTMVAGRIVGFDASDDLVALGTIEGVVNFAFLYGSPTRVLGAPVILATGQSNETVDFPFVVTTGRFDGATLSNGIIAVSPPEQGDGAPDRETLLAAWDVRATTQGRVVTTRTPTEYVIPSDNEGLAVLLSVKGTAGDLDNDGADELVVLTLDEVIQLRLDEGHFDIYHNERFAEPLATAPFKPLTLRHLDGDGLLDMLVTTFNGNLVALWNEDGRFPTDLSDVVVAADAAAESAGEGPATVGDIFDFTALNVDGDTIPDLVIGTSTGCFYVPAEGRSFGTPIWLEDLPPTRALAAGDFNSDGVDDLAIGDPGGFEIFFGIAD